jgi:hypothetical protein
MIGAIEGLLAECGSPTTALRAKNSDPACGEAARPDAFRIKLRRDRSLINKYLEIRQAKPTPHTLPTESVSTS